MNNNHLTLTMNLGFHSGDSTIWAPTTPKAAYGLDYSATKSPHLPVAANLALCGASNATRVVAAN